MVSLATIKGPFINGLCHVRIELLDDRVSFKESQRGGQQEKVSRLCAFLDAVFLE